MNEARRACSAIYALWTCNLRWRLRWRKYIADSTFVKFGIHSCDPSLGDSP
jgi:hypothetical protein